MILSPDQRLYLLNAFTNGIALIVTHQWCDSSVYIVNQSDCLVVSRNCKNTGVGIGTESLSLQINLVGVDSILIDQ